MGFASCFLFSISVKYYYHDQKKMKVKFNQNSALLSLPQSTELPQISGYLRCLDQNGFMLDFKTYHHFGYVYINTVIQESIYLFRLKIMQKNFRFILISSILKYFNNITSNIQYLKSAVSHFLSAMNINKPDHVLYHYM